MDKNSLNSGLFSAFKKTLNKKGYDLEIQQLNKTKVVKLISKTNIIKDDIIIVKI
jgi:hypothetical protein